MQETSKASSFFTINVELDNTHHSFTCRSNQTVLEAAEKAGITLPSSCLVGMCCSCAALLKDGSVEMDNAMGLKSELQDEGYVLLCQTYPKSDLYLLANQFEKVWEQR